MYVNSPCTIVLWNGNPCSIWMSFTQQTVVVCVSISIQIRKREGKTKCKIIFLQSYKYFECLTRDIAFVLIHIHIHIHIYIYVHDTPTIC